MLATIKRVENSIGAVACVSEDIAAIFRWALPAQSVSPLITPRTPHRALNPHSHVCHAAVRIQSGFERGRNRGRPTRSPHRDLSEPCVSEDIAAIFRWALPPNRSVHSLRLGHLTEPSIPIAMSAMPRFQFNQASKRSRPHVRPGHRARDLSEPSRIHPGKRRGVCHRKAIAVRSDYTRQRSSAACEAVDGCRAGATAVGDRRGARRRLARRSREDRRHGASDAARLGNPVQRCRTRRSEQQAFSWSAGQAHR